MFNLFAKVDKSFYLLLIPIFHTFVPWVSWRLRSVISFAIVILWILFVDKRGFKIRAPKFQMLDKAFWGYLISELIYLFLPSVYWCFDHGDLVGYSTIATTLIHLSFVAVMYILVRCGKLHECVAISVVSSIAIVLAGISALRGLNIEGLEAARFLTAHADTYENMLLTTDVATLGLGNYGYMYICAFVFGAFLASYFLIPMGCVRLMIVAALLGMFFCIKGGGLATPVGVMVVGSILSIPCLIKRQNVAIRIVKLLGFGSIVAILLFTYVPHFFSPFSSVLKSISSCMSGGSIKDHVESVADSISGDRDAYASRRYELQRMSFRTFLKNPIFGDGLYRGDVAAYSKKTGIIGGHSLIMDRLGQGGLMGFLPLIFAFYFFIKFMTCLYDFGFGILSRISSYAMLYTFIVAGIANPLPIIIGFLPFALVGFMLLAKDSSYKLTPKWDIVRK